MPKCSACSRSFPNKSDLSLVRGENKRWMVVCRDCSAKMPPPELPSNDPPAETAKPPKTPPSPGSPPPRPPREAKEQPPDAASKPSAQETDNRAKAKPMSPEERQNLALFKEIAAMNRELRQEEEERVPRGYQRAHQRHSTELEIRYSLARDEHVESGEVQDISRGGLRFRGKRFLEQGQYLNVIVLPPGRTEEEAKIRSAAEVRRVRALDDGVYEIGIRFVNRGLIDNANRRTHRRFDIEMPVYYRRQEASLVEKGSAKNISQGGMRLQIRQVPSLGEQMSVFFRAEEGPFAGADVQATARIVRVKEMEKEGADLGLSFSETEIRSRGEEG